MKNKTDLMWEETCVCGDSSESKKILDLALKSLSMTKPFYQVYKPLQK